MMMNGKRVWTIVTDHSIGLSERKTEALAAELTRVLDEHNIENVVKYSDYRVNVEVFEFDAMATVVKTISKLMDEKKFKLTGVKIETSNY